MSVFKMLVINPGSTSTKISLFENETCVFTDSVFHDAPVLLQYPTTNDQVPFRKQVILDILARHSVNIDDIEVWIGRGGCAYSQKAGVMFIDKKLVDDTARDAGGSDHAAKLGVMLAYEFWKEHGGRMYTMNPTNIDELSPLARATGIAGLYRRAQSHSLNQKATAQMHAGKMGMKYEDCNLIVCHIDGGITIGAHQKGRMVDGTEGAGGDGPFSPTRLGSIPVIEVLKYLETHTIEETRRMCSRSGGLVSHFGTSDADRIHALVDRGDEKACLVWNTMIYQICKSIGAMGAVLDGKIDGILLTGGLVRFDDIVQTITRKCSWMAKVYTYPGEVEQEALAYGVLEVLQGKKEASAYTGAPVFSGFPWDLKVF